MLEKAWRKGNTFALLVGMKTGTATMANSGRFIKKLGKDFPYDPSMPMLGIHPEETRTKRDICTPVLTAALFTIARTWKQLRCPSAVKWIRKLRYIYTMEYYSAIKRNTFESVLMRWMILEPIILTEVSQKEKHKYCILTHIYGIQKGSNNPIRRAAKETNVKSKLLDSVGRVQQTLLSVGEGKGGMI